MKHSLPVIVEAHDFAARDFVGGDPALDFVNTVTGRDQTPRDWLDGYERMLDWAAQVELAPTRVLDQLRRKARREPAAAFAALSRAKELREAMFAIGAAIARGETVPKSALSLLREYWLAGANAHELQIVDGGVRPQLRDDAVDFDLVAGLLAHRMVEHVLPQPIERLRICRGPNCSWLFVDSSKAGRRVWCDMAVCGNAAKARRFTARARRRPSRRKAV
jgi:predicted RNA-binding Zn ribbon-like protein